MTDIDPSALDRELKKGAAELLVLSVLEVEQPSPEVAMSCAHPDE
jgi:hypothetical protein